jgi:hypothetical protein
VLSTTKQEFFFTTKQECCLSHSVSFIPGVLAKYKHARQQEYHVQAANYEVFVTQPPDQDPKTCFERNVHRRTAQDVLEASRSLEPSPAAITQLNCAGIIPNTTSNATDSPNPPLPSDSVNAEDSQHSMDTKRKSMDVASVEGGGIEKRSRVGDARGVIDDSAVLAMVDAGFSEGSAGSAKKASKQGNRSRWSDDDDSEEEGVSRWQVRTAQHSQRQHQQLRGAAGTSSSAGALFLPSSLSSLSYDMP